MSHPLFTIEVMTSVAIVDTGDLGGRSDAEVRALVSELEVQARKLAAAQLAVMDEVDARRLYEADGHFTAKVMIRHMGRLSCGEAAGREKARRMLAQLGEIADAYTEGTIGTEQVRLLGRVFANRRVAPFMDDQQGWFIHQARVLEYVEFKEVVGAWERLMDQDGAEPAAERAHRNRDFKLTQDHFGLGWEHKGGCGSLMGAAMNEIHEHYVHAEWLADWEKARDRFGDEATVDDLPRTDAQRRADALYQIFVDAASIAPGSKKPRFVHNIVWDHTTYEQMLAELDGRPRQTLDPETYRCSTIDGVPLAPTEAILNSLVSEFRRVIVDAEKSVIDLGRARSFTGSARLAAQLAAMRCPFVGCLVKSSQCEIDHRKPWAQGGRTHPDNGDPLCGGHNRLKQTGFTVWRDPQGHWHTYRPDGTEIE